jgi:hypothetical protein
MATAMAMAAQRGDSDSDGGDVCINEVKVSSIGRPKERNFPQDLGTRGATMTHY